MKRYRFIGFIAALAFMLASCDETGDQAVLNSNVESNELVAPASSILLTMANKDEVAQHFEWTATDFGFGASINYKLQMDKVGNNFATPHELASTNALDADVKVGAMNEGLLALELTPEQASDVEFRVVSTVSPSVDPIYSNVQSTSVTPYATSFPSIWGMGAALNGWGPWPDKAVEWQSTEFKKYQTVAYLINGEAFRWFDQLDWSPTSYNYPYFTTVSPIFVNAADGDSNLKVAGASGWYTVSVDLGAKTVTAEAVSEPVLYMMGSAINGWGPWPDAAVKMTYIKPGVFETTTTLNNVPDNNTFRFFAQADWSPTGYNYPYFTGGVDALFENANDGDSNLRYIGTTGTQKIRVDLNAKTVTLGDPPAPVLFITGDDFGWGWNDGQYVEMTYNSGSGTLTATATLTNGNLFRFFPQKDWNPSYTFDYFTSVDSDLENQGAGTDQNFRYIGTTGSRTITVNLTTKAVSLD